MRFINKKVVVVVLLLIEFTCGYLMYQSSKKNIDLAKVTYEEEINKNMFAMYVENEDTGEYDEVTNTNTFPEGYILNMDKTGCIDNKGNSISDILTSKDDKVMVKSNKTVFCYLYFDKDNRVFAQVKRDYKNNTGALLLSETESDEYPVYYYTGKITNNNILYANFCWKMVRTTETGGVKLIYNGVPDESEDGTLTCDNTGTESQIGTSKFNPNMYSPAYVGYMYNKIYSISSKGATSTRIFPELRPGDNNIYYGDSFTHDGSTYILNNSDGSEVTTYKWADDYAALIGKYTCLSSTEKSCTELYYVVGNWSNLVMYYYLLTEGKDYDDYKMKLATSITDNGDGTYTLVEPFEVVKADWYKNYSNYKKYYVCNDTISENCSDMYYLTSPDSINLIGFKSNAYKYGNSFIYENGTYKLVNTKEFWNWPDNYNTLNNHHYTCFNTTGECEEIKYIYHTNSSTAYYITLKDGKTVEKALNEMLYADDVNTTDSTIKEYIDTWYEGAILDKTDRNGIMYSSYLENTIWCNNRVITSLGGWSMNNSTTSLTSLRFNNDSLECENKTDQFTLKVEAGGTEGYGNNALDYPIALLTYKEVSLSASFLQNNSGWTISPSEFVEFYTRVSGGNVINTASVRPSVSLSNKVEIIDGNGEVDNPYQIILLN